MGKLPKTPSEDHIDIMRRRPSMYIGNVDQDSVLHLLEILLMASTEEAFVGRCDYIYIELRDQGEIFYADTGLGLPIEVDPESGISYLERVMSVNAIHEASGTHERYSVIGGTCRIGFATVNALSAEFKVKTVRNAQIWEQTYSQGRPVSRVKTIRALMEEDKFGIMLTFRPDRDILPDNPVDLDNLIARCEELAYIAKGLKITIVDKRIDLPHEIVIRKPNGLADLVVDMCRDNQLVGELFFAERRFELPKHATYLGESKLSVRVALQLSASTESNIKGYVNTWSTPKGGSHVLATRSGILDALEIHIARIYYHYSKKMLSWQDVPIGFQACVSIIYPDPHLISEMLISSEVYEPIVGFVFQTFMAYLQSGKQDTNMWKKMITQRSSEREK